MDDVKTQASTAAGAATKPPAAARPDVPWQPLAAIRDEVERIFEDAWRGFGGGGARPLRRVEAALGIAAPAIDLVEAEGEYRVSAELPGLEAKDVELSVSDDMLTIRGEKRETKEQATGTYVFAERRFGAFQRALRLPPGVDQEKVSASFDKGVLTVTLPKTAAAAERQRRVEIRQGE
jgi:HSP20 family protein